MTKRYNNKEAKRTSVMREYLSNAALIGLANLYGVDMIVKVPTTHGTKELKSCLNVTVQQTSLSGDIQSITSETITKITNPTEVRLDKQKRNAKKSMEAMMMNQMAEFIFMKDPQLQFTLTKTRPTQKTMKLFKYRSIDPFNEEGFKVFGERMIDILQTIATTSTTGNAKQTIVYLPQNHPEIVMLYCNMLRERDMLSMNGLRYSEYVSTSCGSNGEEQMEIEINQEVQCNQENMF